MTDYHKEQHPLLCDEFSDEEFHIHDNGPKIQRRFSRSVSSGRARTHAAGAAAIITSWPDHISSLLAYWWIGLGMIAVMVFLIYNSFLAIAVLPHSDYYPSKIQSTKHSTENKSVDNPSIPNIYMHVFVTNYNEFNSNNYIPYIQALSKKYTNYKYNLVVVLNDATQDIVNDLSDENKNEMALNLILSNNKIMNKKKLHDNPTVKFISLTKFMDNSPLKKYWRLLPYQFIGFLVRCIAIWDKGGVAFNPLILTPNSPSSIYLEKIHSVLESFQFSNRLMSTKKRKVSKKSKKKLNNIRDIINDLENGDMNANIFTDSLSEAEDVQLVTINSLKSKRNVNLISIDQHNFQQEDLHKQKDEVLHKNKSNTEAQISSNVYKTINTVNSTKASGIEAVKNIFPKFLDFFFHLNSKNSTSKSQNFTRDVNLSENLHFNDFLNKNITSKIGPNIIDPSVKIKTKSTNKTSSENENTKLIIDLKGNLIATETGCHAFIGTLFTNVIHHTHDESVTEFIINDLSLFCKGSLSSCNNVEVLLL